MAEQYANTLTEAQVAQVTRRLGDLLERYGEEPLARVMKCVEHAVGATEPQFNHPLQRPEAIFMPGLPARPWFSLGSHPTTRELERRFVEAFPFIRDEYLAVSRAGEASGDGGFVDHASLGANGYEKFHTLKRNDWSVLFLLREGKPVPENVARCPRTAAFIDSISPHLMAQAEVFFSVLEPGTRLPPHHDASNCKLNFHLALVVPPRCGIRVGGEVRTWTEGECLAFDDTFEHEAWNESDRRRAVLIVDLWHPEVSEVERLALGALVDAASAS